MSTQEPPHGEGAPGHPLPYPSDVYPPSTYSGRGYPNQLYPPQPAPDSPWPLVVGEPPPARRRPPWLVGVALALVLVLAGGLVVRLTIGGGSAEPADAVEGFLTAVYTRHNAEAAAGFVCPRARDEAELRQVVFEVKTFQKDYPTPRTTWTYPSIQPDGREAAAFVTLTMITANEQVSSRELRLLLVDDRGWWVCDVEASPRN